MQSNLQQPNIRLFWIIIVLVVLASLFFACDARAHVTPAQPSLHPQLMISGYPRFF